LLVLNARVALVNDWLDTWAGGESVLEQVALLFPGAPVYTLVDFMPPPLRERLGEREIRTSYLQRVPGARHHFRRLLPLFPSAVERLDLSGFDVIVSISHAVAKGVHHDAGQFHFCYCLSPIRYAWDLREQYLRQVGLQRGPAGYLAGKLLDRIAAWDARSSERVDEFVAISQHIRARIRRCYGRDAGLVYPPVALAAFERPRSQRKRYVTVSRLVPYKRVDVIAAAFARLPGRELVIVGEGPERLRVEAVAGPNVFLAGQVGDARRDELLRESRAFLFAADEDFGIAPVEAQAMGVPVIAYGRGGVTETILGLDHPQPTGLFFDDQTPEAVAAAVLRFEANEHRFDPAACRRNAERFGAERFREEFRASLGAAHERFLAERNT
jgi:glycosyltransferase involved in cell wall biosynthesis